MNIIKRFVNRFRDYFNSPVMNRLEKLETINKNLLFLINQSIDITKVKTLPSIEHIQKQQIEVLRKYDKFLKNINVEYFLMYGSLLGVIRNKSYVPWDDDIDIGIFYEDFYKILENEKFLKDFGLGLSSPFTLKNNFKHPGWHKIFNLETNFHIDVFLFDIVNDENKNNIIKIKDRFAKLANNEMLKFKSGELKFEVLKERLNQLNKTYFSKLDFTTKELATKDSYIIPNITNYNSLILTNFAYIFPIQETEFNVSNKIKSQLIVSIPNKPEEIIIDMYGKDYMFFPNRIFPLHKENHNL